MRRKLIHEGINQRPLSTLSFVNRYIPELEQLHAPTPMHTLSAHQCAEAVPRWRTPPEGITKFYVDAGISHDHEVSLAATVCRDRNGAYLGSSVLVIRGLLNPEKVEAIACREALALADESTRILSCFRL